jgi:Ca-activated chloride channel homolog
MSISPVVPVAWLVVAGAVGLALVVLGAVFARRGRWVWVLRAVMVALLVVIGLRPGLPGDPATAPRPELEVVLVIDNTASMAALDGSGGPGDAGDSRLDAVRRDVASLVELLPEAKFTVVSFGNDPLTQLPSTQDSVLVVEQVELLRPEAPAGALGSRLDQPLTLVTEQLETLKERTPRRGRVVVVMTDGERTSLAPQRSFSVWAPLVDAGVVLGYGTASGGLMPRPDSSGWVPDPATGEPAVSRLDRANLRAIAAEMDVAYLGRARGESLASTVAGWEAAVGERLREVSADESARRELGWLFALALLGVVLVDLRLQWRRLLAAAREAS